jgi:hypothetical protein
MFERAMNEAHRDQERRRRLHAASPHMPVAIPERDEDDLGVDEPILLAITCVAIVVAAVVVLVAAL